jgi:hypothetical protein
MNIVQSCWSCNQQNFPELNAGWLAPEYNLMSWTLSCLQLKKFYKKVTLYTDGAAAKILIDTLHLPYDEVICDLDKLKIFDPKLWALPKIYTYQQQKAPFLHVDGDVFIWQEFDKHLLNSPLIAQNLEVSTDYYEGVMKGLETKLSFLPAELIEERKNNDLVYAFNAGILGGTDVGFFEEYTKKAFDFVNRNLDNLQKINIGTFNIFFEQHLFYCLAKKQGKPVNVLFPDIIGDNQYTGFDDFAEVPHNKKYLHLLGTYKGHVTVCEQMAARLRYDYPEYYYKIVALYQDRKRPLYRDYYQHLGVAEKNSLVSRYYFLKDAFNKNKLKTKTKDAAAQPAFIPFRGQLIKKLIDSGQTNSTGIKKTTALKYNRLLKDADMFESKLSKVLRSKFAAYSHEYLYARDINSTAYHHEIFGATDRGPKQIVADKSVAIIKSRFDWSKVDPGISSATDLIKISNSEVAATYTAVIPQAYGCGYTLMNIDELDLLILNILNRKKNISNVLEETTTAFDEQELADHRAEFELLITGRVKMGLKNKLIKTV